MSQRNPNAIYRQAVAARRAGQRIFIGPPCPHGHTERMVTTGQCQICHDRQVGRMTTPFILDQIAQARARRSGGV